jgi:hypothetical protein
MSIGLILVILLLFGAFGSFPSWGYSRNWGYTPFGGFGLILVIIVILMLVGRL